MKPIEILRRYQGAVTLIDDCVLEYLCELDSPTTVQVVVNTCISRNIASQATLHKALSKLAEVGYIKTVNNKADFDTRKRWVAVTAAGQRRAKEWA
jgi:DNA-binding MarR family transcriptional regulator